jgi:elongation factor 1-beta
LQSFTDEPAPKKPAAVSYPELSDAEKAKLNGKLLDFPYVSGYTPSQEDVFFFVQIKKVDEKLVNLARWWRNIASYESEFASLPGEPKIPGASG